MSSAPSCSLCCQDLRNPRERRVLHNPATAPVWSVVSAVATELFPGGVETIFPCKAYLCKLCVRTVEKLIRLRESVCKEENELKGKVSRAGEAKGLCHGEDSDRNLEDAGETLLVYVFIVVWF